MIDNLKRLLQPISLRISNMVARAVIQAVQDDKKLQELTLELLPGEVRDEIEHFQQYGFTSNPRPGAEAVVLFVGGRRDHGLAIATDDRRFRPTGLQPGEVAVYNDTGAKIVMRANGDVEVIPGGSGKLKVISDVEITGRLKVVADVEVTGTLTASVDVVGGGKSLKTHTHVMTPASSPIAVAGTTGLISGTTDGPA